MATRKTFVRTNWRNGVCLTAQLPLRKQPRAGDVLAAAEQWLARVRLQLLDVSPDGPVSRRSEPYQLGSIPSHNHAAACTFTLVIEGDPTPLTMTQYVELTVEFQETLTAILTQRDVR